MSSLDRVFAFVNVVQSTVSSPVSGASTDIRVYNGAAKLIQQVAVDKTSQNPHTVSAKVRIQNRDTNVFVPAVLWLSGPPWI